MTTYYSRNGLWRVQTVALILPDGAFLRVSKRTPSGTPRPVALGGGWWLAQDCRTPEEVARWVDLAELLEQEPGP